MAAVTANRKRDMVVTVGMVVKLIPGISNTYSILVFAYLLILSFDTFSSFLSCSVFLLHFNSLAIYLLYHARQIKQQP